jgi:hypothetical protein
MFELLDYPPVSGAVAFAALLVCGRVLINRHVRRHPENFALPKVFALLVILALSGMLATCVWALVSIGVFAAMIVFGLYTATCLVPSRLIRSRPSVLMFPAAQSGHHYFEENVQPLGRSARLQEIAQVKSGENRL